MKKEILAARVASWPSFKIRKYSKERGEPLGLILAEAIQVYLSQMGISEGRIKKWLKEYRGANKGNPDAMD